MDANTPFNSQDHDLLIEVNTNVKNLTATLQSYTVSSNQTSEKHDSRLQQLEAQQNILKGSQRTMKTVGAFISILLTLATVAIGIISIVQK